MIRWLIACIAIRAPLLATEPGDDAYRCLWEGRVQLAGFNPFLHPPDDPSLAHLREEDWAEINHPDYPAIYGPIAQVQFVAAAGIHPSVYTLKLMHALWDVFVVFVLAASLRRAGRRPHWALAYGLCPLVLAAFAIEGHLDSLMLLFVALTVWAVVVLVLGTVLSALARGRCDFTQYGAAATGTLLVLMPVVHYWYLCWTLVLIPFGVRAH